MTKKSNSFINLITTVLLALLLLGIAVAPVSAAIVATNGSTATTNVCFIVGK